MCFLFIYIQKKQWKAFQENATKPWIESVSLNPGLTSSFVSSESVVLVLLTLLFIDFLNMCYNTAASVICAYL